MQCESEGVSTSEVPGSKTIRQIAAGGWMMDNVIPALCRHERVRPYDLDTNTIAGNRIQQRMGRTAVQSVPPDDNEKARFSEHS